MKILIFIFSVSFLNTINIHAQVDYHLELENIIKNKYLNNPFEGVKIVDFVDKQFMVSMAITSEANHKTTSSLNRVCMIKARREALRFINSVNQ